MALFRRNKTDEAAVPPEVQSYYQAENRERTWVAWLLAIATLFVTVLVVLGLFFGGRWAYRKINNNDNKNTATVQTDTSKEKDTATTPANPSQANGGSSSSPGSATPPTTTPSATPTTTGSTTTPSTGSGTATAPAPQATNPNLPNTGPGDILAIFVVTSIAAGLFYDRVLRTRSHRS